MRQDILAVATENRSPLARSIGVSCAFSDRTRWLALCAATYTTSFSWRSQNEAHAVGVLFVASPSTRSRVYHHPALQTTFPAVSTGLVLQSRVRAAHDYLSKLDQASCIRLHESCLPAGRSQSRPRRYWLGQSKSVNSATIHLHRWRSIHETAAARRYCHLKQAESPEHFYYTHV